MTTIPAALPSRVVPTPEAPERPQRSGVKVGDLAIIHADKSFGVYLPGDKNPTYLDGKTVKILDERYDSLTNTARAVMFRLEPWPYGDDVVLGWWADEHYFESLA